jgi:hypothetical protein
MLPLIFLLIAISPSSSTEPIPIPVVGNGHGHGGGHDFDLLVPLPTAPAATSGNSRLQRPDSGEANLRERIQFDRRSLAEKHSQLMLAQAELKHALGHESEQRSRDRIAHYRLQKSALLEHEQQSRLFEEHREKEFSARLSKISARRAARLAWRLAKRAERRMRQIERMERRRNLMALRQAAAAARRAKLIESRLAGRSAFLEQSEIMDMRH